MKAEAIQKILSSKDLERTSQELPLSLPVVKGIQLQWLRRISGKCVVCGKLSEQDNICQTCRRHHHKSLAPDNADMIRMLERIDKRKPLLRRVCAECQQEQTLTAGQVIRLYQRYGSKFFRQDWLCGPCFKTQNEEQYQHLTYRPFKALKLKIPG